MNDGALRLTRKQALALRLARHHLIERLGAAGTRSAAVVGLQDTPPGTAAVALAVRADVAPEALDELVLVPSVRGAPLAVAQQDLAVTETAGGSDKTDDQQRGVPSAGVADREAHVMHGRLVNAPAIAIEYAEPRWAAAEPSSSDCIITTTASIARTHRQGVIAQSVPARA